jgi:hypothetical protein
MCICASTCRSVCFSLPPPLSLPFVRLSVCVCVSVCSVDRALDFTRVSDESTTGLSPSYDLPYSYMAGIAEK